MDSGRAVIASGAEGRRLYLDAVEAALHKPGGKKGAALPRNLAEDVLVRQLRQAERIRRQLDRYLNEQVRANEKWVPDPDFVEASAKNTMAIKAALAELRALRKDAAAARKGLTDEQLDAVFKHSLRRIAQSMPAEDWRVLLSIGFGSDVADVLLRGKDPGWSPPAELRRRP